MLSFIISNVLVCTNSLLGLTPTTLENNMVVSEPVGQTITIYSQSPQDAHRDNFSVNAAPISQTAILRSQNAPQSLPPSNSVLVNSAMKYLGAGWDCTLLVEQALRDLGYTVGDLGPTQFGGYGVVFYNPSQVEPGDIMMRGGHVAIYAGDGMAIQGGFGFGGVVYTNLDADPAGYYSFVRIG